MEVTNYSAKDDGTEDNQDPTSLYSIANKEWQKNVLHFGGGSDSAEQAYINSWLNIYKNIVEDTLYGGHVYTFNKDPFSNDINNNDFQFVQSKLEEGVSIITFLLTLVPQLDLVKTLMHLKIGIIPEIPLSHRSWLLHW